MMMIYLEIIQSMMQHDSRKNVCFFVTRQVFLLLRQRFSDASLLSPSSEDYILLSCVPIWSLHPFISSFLYLPCQMALWLYRIRANMKKMEEVGYSGECIVVIVGQNCHECFIRFCFKWWIKCWTCLKWIRNYLFDNWACPPFEF